MEDESAVATGVGQRLLELRGDRSQRGMAESVNVALQTWARYERGERLPDAEVLIELQRQGVDLNWLLDGRRTHSGHRPFTVDLGNDKLSSEFVLVPRYNLTFEGGEGNEPFEDGDLKPSQIAFRRDWLEAEGIADDPLSVYECDGESMFPTIPRGYIVLVNERFKKFSKPGIYALMAFGRYVLKSIDVDLITGDLTLISANPDKNRYPNRVVTSDLEDELHFVGRAIWWAPGHADM